MIIDFIVIIYALSCIFNSPTHTHTHTHTHAHTPSLSLTHPPHHVHSYHAHTTKMDTARVEKQTFVCTEKKSDAVPSPKPGVVSKLGNWKSPKEMDAELNEKFKGCMKGIKQ